jgi:hypothetical protein
MYKYIRLTDKEKVDIVTAYTVQLVPMIKLAEQYGVTRQGIHKVLKRTGIDTSKKAAHILVSCTTCGKEFKKVRCIIRKSKHVFCCNECYFVWLKHGNGQPLQINRHKTRIARAVVSRYYALRPKEVVHHKDRNQYNNLINNLMVFVNQGDHVRHHRDFLVPIMFDGNTIKGNITG